MKLFLFAGMSLGLVVLGARAQGDGGFDTIANLPACAQGCASTAAAAVNCPLCVISLLVLPFTVRALTFLLCLRRTDLPCLCAASGFPGAVESCAFTPGTCGREDLAAVSSIIAGLCTNGAFLSLPHAAF